MHAVIAQFRAACLPFVTRTFRGQRGRRTLLLSGVLALVAVLSGLWLSQGRGDFEREVRQALEVERSTWEREHAEYVIIAQDPWYYQSLLAEVSQLPAMQDRVRGYTGTVHATREGGLDTLIAATMFEAPPQHRALVERARALLATQSRQWAREDYGLQGFSWQDPNNVERLQHIVDQDLVPGVELYRSPVDTAGTVRFIGFVAGGLLAAMLLVGAPLLAGVQLAQEVHENTLQPVTGTALSPRQLVVGLTSGPLAQAGVLVAPQALIVLLAALLAGAILPAVGFLVLSVVFGVFLSMLTQLVGYGAGRRRAPGLIGVALLGLLGVALLTGAGIGFNLDDDLLGLVTIVPQSGVAHLLREAFVPLAELDVAEALRVDVRLFFSGVAFAILAGVAALALQRRISGRTTESLRAREAWVGVLTLIAAALLALPRFDSHEDVGVATYFLSLGLLVIPFQLVLMGRVTLGDGPSATQRIPWGRRLGEFAAYLGVHGVVVSLVVGGPQEIGPLSASGLFHLAWALWVAALIAIRVVAVPLKPAAAVWVMICLGLSVAEFTLGVSLNADAGRSYVTHREYFLPLFEVSVVLGLIETALMVVVPFSLIRALEKGGPTPG